MDHAYEIVEFKDNANNIRSVHYGQQVIRFTTATNIKHWQTVQCHSHGALFKTMYELTVYQNI